MSRASRGCLPCRTRRVKCDLGKPNCERCIKRGIECHGYRDELSLLFRSENEKTVQNSLRKYSSDQELSRSSASDSPSSLSNRSSGQSPAPSRSALKDLATLSIDESLELNLPNPYPWLKALPLKTSTSAEEQAVSHFFDSFVVYPGSEGSTPGFLEHLPSLFKDVSANNRCALRWAVYAVSYANLSKDQNSIALGNKAMQCYGKALRALAKALSDDKDDPDDYCLMTVVVLDLFETLYKSDTVTLGSHAEGMKQILRLRGKEQLHSARGWSLFRLAHHRLQRQQLAFKEVPMPESEFWMESLDENIPDVMIEKHSHEISKTCERARSIWQTWMRKDCLPTHC